MMLYIVGWDKSMKCSWQWSEMCTCSSCCARFTLFTKRKGAASSCYIYAYVSIHLQQTYIFWMISNKPRIILSSATQAWLNVNFLSNIDFWKTQQQIIIFHFYLIVKQQSIRRVIFAGVEDGNQIPVFVVKVEEIIRWWIWRPLCSFKITRRRSHDLCVVTSARKWRQNKCFVICVQRRISLRRDEVNGA